MTFSQVCEEYPDYLAELSDEQFDHEQDADWDESGWNESQIVSIKRILKAESVRRYGM